MTIEEAREKEIFLPYQKRWLNDTSQIKIWEKSRRIGASYTDSFLAAKYAALTSSDGGMDTYYMGTERDMTQQYVSDCAFWAKLLGYACGEMEEVVIKDDDKDILIFKIRFDSGFEVWGMPCVPRLFRSKQGRAVLDEAAFADDLRELIKATVALTMWGGLLSIISTHNGDDNPFNEIITETLEGRNNYSHHKTTITEALKDGLYKRICEVKKLEWNPENENKWLTDLEKNYGEGADEELYCIPSSSGKRYFSSALVQSVATKNIPVFRFAENDSFTFEDKRKREKRCLEWFKEIKPTLVNAKKPVVLGEDFARSGDLTVLWFDEVFPTETKALCVIELRNIPFDQQWQFIELCGNNLTDFLGAAFDARGNGQMIAEKAAQEWRGSVFQVMLSRKWYAENMPKLKSGLEDKTTDVPDDLFLKEDFKVVQLQQGIPLIVERTGTHKNKRHGDGCIAKAMAVFAANELDGAGYQPMTYEAVGTPNRFKTVRSDPWDD